MARFLDLPLACASLFRFMLVGSSARCGVGRRQRGLLIFSVPSFAVAAPPSRHRFPVSPLTSRLHPAGHEAWCQNVPPVDLGLDLGFGGCVECAPICCRTGSMATN